MKTLQITILFATFLITTTTMADNDCTDPVAEWQSQESLRQLLIENGWEVKRIKIDDGCYEAKGFDKEGHNVEAKFSPATLEILELKVKFKSSGNRSGYFKNHKRLQKSTENTSTQKSPQINVQ